MPGGWLLLQNGMRMGLMRWLRGCSRKLNAKSKCRLRARFTGSLHSSHRFRNGFMPDGFCGRFRTEAGLADCVLWQEHERASTRPKVCRSRMNKSGNGSWNCHSSSKVVDSPMKLSLILIVACTTLAQETPPVNEPEKERTSEKSGRARRAVGV